ncbi:Glycosyl transferase family 2 [Modestobacter sp. DSM 44400]|uniref:glycosyltransferase family 2 protein n=1 Tax=Modestobacter sp. DSM 44400 TaxID=1550230 RepID=UPI000895F6F9|nr:glycosyltransferase [Modestobacter sp. DSM 44400]SDX49382.1 Glycosyl transferase family 2 [Modestobacter sp. DSM 44400]
MTLDIMIPFYGDPDMLRQTVTSVLTQTDPGWRLTVVDDGYPDPSVAEWFGALDDERVTYVRNEQNLGANKNYEKCMTLATEQDVVILGADDLLMPEYVSVVTRARAAFPEAAVIQPGVKVIDEHGVESRTLVDETKKRLYAPKLSQRASMSGEELARSLLRGNWLYFPSLVFDVEKVRAIGFRPGLDVVQDLALVLDLVMRGESLVVDPTTCFAYRRHGGSDSSWRAVEGSRFREERAFFLGAAAELEKLGWTRAARAARLHASSRMHALTYLPVAVRKRKLGAVRVLLDHGFGGLRDELGRLRQSAGGTSNPR